MPSYIVKNDIVHVYPVDPKCAAGKVTLLTFNTLEEIDSIASKSYDVDKAKEFPHYPFRCVRCIPA